MGRPLSEPHLSRNDGVSAYGTISTVDESPLDGDIVWVGTDDGNVQVTRDGGTTWTNVVANVPGLPARRYVSGIEASAHEAGRAYLPFDGHFDDDYAPWVFVTEDFGASWRDLSNGLPQHSINVVREHFRTPELLFVGNEVGAWASVDRGQSWHRLGGGLPTVPVDDIQIHPRDNDLLLGTHGRSIWIADDITPLEGLSSGMTVRSVHLFPVRAGTLRAELGGWPFWGDAFFGANPPEGALIRYHLGSEIDLESIPLVVLDAAGDTVRVLDGPTGIGPHTVAWDLRMDPPFEVEEGAGGGGGGFFGGAPSGPTVLPGRYTVRAEVAGVVMDEPVEVRLDPELATTNAALAARQRALMDAYALASPVREAQQRLDRLGDQLDDVRDLVAEHEGASDALRERVDSLRARVEEVDDELGSVNGASRLGFQIEGSYGPPTADQLWRLDEAWAELPGLVGRVNDLVTTEVPALYRELDRLGIRPDPGEGMPVPSRPAGG
jgi:hypothetical protein